MWAAGLMWPFPSLHQHPYCSRFYVNLFHPKYLQSHSPIRPLRMLRPWYGTLFPNFLSNCCNCAYFISDISLRRAFSTRRPQCQHRVGVLLWAPIGPHSQTLWNEAQYLLNEWTAALFLAGPDSFLNGPTWHKSALWRSLKTSGD